MSLAIHPARRCLALLALAALPLRAQQPDPIRYTVRIPAPATHYLEVEASYPDLRASRRSTS